MLIVLCLQWWYGRGWRWRINHARKVLSNQLDYFSFGHLLKSLFEPYRQTFANQQRRSMGDQLKAVQDSLISRFVGFWVRLFILIAGGIVMSGYLLWQGLMLALWPLLPTLPILGIMVMVLGVGK